MKTSIEKQIEKDLNYLAKVRENIEKENNLNILKDIEDSIKNDVFIRIKRNILSLFSKKYRIKKNLKNVEDIKLISRKFKELMKDFKIGRQIVYSYKCNVQFIEKEYKIYNITYDSFWLSNRTEEISYEKARDIILKHATELVKEDYEFINRKEKLNKMFDSEDYSI